jgi:predicted DNA-binding transcriptional regulator YafY
VRAPRLIQLILILQTHGHRTAAALADELGVSVRTVYRDLEALGAVGVPVVAERGPGGGCRLLGGYRTQLTGLSAGEADALFLAGAPVAAAELGLGGLLADAQRKLSAALPKPLRGAAALASQRFLLDPRDWFEAPPEHPALAALAIAVWGDRRVAFTYRRDERRSRGAPVLREVDPIALVLKAGLWYLVARVGRDLRTYRVSRIDGVRVSDVSFARDPAFDLRAHWERAAHAFEEGIPALPVRVRVSPRERARLERLGEPIRRAGASAAAEPDPERRGWTRHTLVFERLEYARAALLDFGGALEVLAPPELRAALRSTARAVAARYGRGARPAARSASLRRSRTR